MAKTFSELYEWQRWDFMGAARNKWWRQHAYSWDYFYNEILEDTGDFVVNTSRLPQIIQGFQGMVMGLSLNPKAVASDKKFLANAKTATNLVNQEFQRLEFPNRLDTWLQRLIVGGMAVHHVEIDPMDWDEKYPNGRICVYDVDPRLCALDVDAQSPQDAKRFTVRYIMRRDEAERKFGKSVYTSVAVDWQRPGSIPPAGMPINFNLVYVYRTVWEEETEEYSVLPTDQDCLNVYQLTGRVLIPNQVQKRVKALASFPFEGKVGKRKVKKWKSAYYSAGDILEEERFTATGNNPYIITGLIPIDGTAYSYGMAFDIKDEIQANAVLMSIMMRLAAASRGRKIAVNGNFFTDGESQLFADALADDDPKRVEVFNPKDPISNQPFVGDMKMLTSIQDPLPLDPSLPQLAEIFNEATSKKSGFLESLSGEAPASDPAVKLALAQKSATVGLQAKILRIEQGLDALATEVWSNVKLIVDYETSVRKFGSKHETYAPINKLVTGSELQLLLSSGELNEDDSWMPAGGDTYVVNPVIGDFGFNISIDPSAPSEKVVNADRALQLLNIGLISKREALRRQPGYDDDPDYYLNEATQEQQELLQQQQAMQQQQMAQQAIMSAPMETTKQGDQSNG